jgi:hypothetical protein
MITEEIYDGFTDKLKYSFSKSNNEIQKLYLYLLNEIVKRFSPVGYYSTNKPDYRFKFINNIGSKKNKKSKVRITTIPQKKAIWFELYHGAIPLNNTELLEFKVENKNGYSKSTKLWTKEQIDQLLNDIIPQVIKNYLPINRTNTKGNEQRKSSNIKNNSSKNIILFGPPGTGKTYRTKQIAVDIITKFDRQNNDKND